MCLSCVHLLFSAEGLSCGTQTLALPIPTQLPLNLAGFVEAFVEPLFTFI